MQLQYRKLNHEEMRSFLPQFQALAMQSYGVYAEGLGPEAYARMMTNFALPAFWEELLPAAICFVCEDAQQLAGMAFLVPSGHPWKFFPAEWAYVRMVGVSTAHQGQGIARRLMEMLILEAQSLREETLALHTSSIMHAARHLYATMGFTIHHELDPKGNAQYWVYTLSLKSSETSETSS
jgi:GNAT superfamily N-acetyltransferase